MGIVKTQRGAWSESLSGPRACLAISLGQIVLAAAWVVWLSGGGPTQNDVEADLELYSFFAIVPVWIVFVFLDMWLLRHVGRDANTGIIRVGLVMSLTCGGIGTAIVGVIVLADIVFWWTDF